MSRPGGRSHRASPVLTDRTNVLSSTSHGYPFRERRGCSGVPSGTLGRGSSAPGRARGAPGRARGAPRRARRGVPGRGGGRSPGHRPATHFGRRLRVCPPRKTSRRAGDLDRFPRSRCDPRLGRPATCCDHRASRRRDERQDDPGAAGNRPDPGRGWDSRVPGPGSKPGPGRSRSQRHPARMAGRDYAGFTRGSAGHGRDAPSGSNGRSPGS